MGPWAARWHLEYGTSAAYRSPPVRRRRAAERRAGRSAARESVSWRSGNCGRVLQNLFDHVGAGDLVISVRLGAAIVQEGQLAVVETHLVQGGSVKVGNAHSALHRFIAVIVSSPV